MEWCACCTRSRWRTICVECDLGFFSKIHANPTFGSINKHLNFSSFCEFLFSFVAFVCVCMFD